MKEQIAIRLYEDASVPTGCHAGRFKPDDLKGWNVERGDTVPLSEENGGRVFGVVDSIDDEVHTDDGGHRYKLAVVWTQD